MKPRQSGFTLIEIAIVLLIIGLLLGGILKGQELQNRARTKSLENDFRAISSYMYGYQDRYRALPGDDASAGTHLPGGTVATTGGATGNSLIEGNWNSTTPTDETFLFWQHLRLANLAGGPVDTAAPDYLPRNSMAGRVGISSTLAAQMQILGMTGTYQICSETIPGKIVMQLEARMDDGRTETGWLRAVPKGSPLGTPATATAAINVETIYTVCYVF